MDTRTQISSQKTMHAKARQCTGPRISIGTHLLSTGANLVVTLGCCVLIVSDAEKEGVPPHPIHIYFEGH